MTALNALQGEDAQLEKAIDRALQAGRRFPRVFNVVRDGFVYLVGYVECAETKKEIEILVQGIPGVRIVTNHLRIYVKDEKRAMIHF